MYQRERCQSQHIFILHNKIVLIILVPIGDKQALDIVKDICPHLITEHAKDGRLELCCEIKQLSEAKAQFSTLSGIVGRCPTCFGNFKRLFCDLACHPSEFSS